MCVCYYYYYYYYYYITKYSKGINYFRDTGNRTHGTVVKYRIQPNLIID